MLFPQVRTFFLFAAHHLLSHRLRSSNTPPPLCSPPWLESAESSLCAFMSCHFTLGSYKLSEAGLILPAPCVGEAERTLVTFQSRNSFGPPVCPMLFLGLQTHPPHTYIAYKSFRRFRKCGVGWLAPGLGCFCPESSNLHARKKEEGGSPLTPGLPNLKAFFLELSMETEIGLTRGNPHGVSGRSRALAALRTAPKRCP